MTFKSDVMEIIKKREEKIDEVLDTVKDSSKDELSEKMDLFWNEICDAKEFANKNDKIEPKEDYGFVYTLMNEYSAYRAFAMVARIYQIRHKSKKRIRK